MNESTISKISKSGRNLYAIIPTRDKHMFNKGDKVKITVIEKNNVPLKDKIDQQVKDFIKNPNGSKLKGHICGYAIDLPLSKLLQHMDKKVAEEIIKKAILEKN